MTRGGVRYRNVAGLVGSAGDVRNTVIAHILGPFGASFLAGAPHVVLLARLVARLVQHLLNDTQTWRARRRTCARTRSLDGL